MLVFVYGTLKTGEPNYHVMSQTAGSHRLVSTGITQEKYPLVVGTKYNIPFLLNEPGKGFQIHGELYEIDDEKLRILDELEAYPTLYDRQKIEIQQTSDSTIVEAYIYLLKKWRKDLLETSTPMMENYSSLGDHGRPYVDRYVRAIEMLEDESSVGPNIYREILGECEDLADLVKRKAEFDMRTIFLLKNTYKGTFSGVRGVFRRDRARNE